MPVANLWTLHSNPYFLSQQAVPYKDQGSDAGAHLAVDLSRMLTTSLVQPAVHWGSHAVPVVKCLGVQARVGSLWYNMRPVKAAAMAQTETWRTWCHMGLKLLPLVWWLPDHTAATPVYSWSHAAL